MTFEQRMIAFVQAVGADIKTAFSRIGNPVNLTTSAKGDLVSAINEIKAVQSNAVLINDTTASATTTYSSSKIDAQVTAAIAATVNGAPAAFDTLKEIADQLVADESGAAALATAVGFRVRVDAVQAFTAPQQAQGRANIGALSTVELGNPDADLVAAYNTAKA